MTKSRALRLPKLTLLLFLPLLLWLGIPAFVGGVEPTSQATTTAVEAHGDDHGGGGHADPAAPVLLEVLIILLLAKVGGHVVQKFGQPGVLGELLVGVAIGALGLVWQESHLHQIIANARTDGSHLDILARIGAVLLLFEVGLESSLGDMVKVGVPSLLVALVGVVAPFGLGFLASKFFVTSFPPGVNPTHVHLFIGATLAATSVGITARVFKDLNRLQSREARVILGAAVIDDVLGLIILAVVSGIIVAAATGSEASMLSIAGITTLKAFGFLGLALLLGIKVGPAVFKVASRLQGTGLLITCALAFCFLISYLANAAGLAMIVGAFAAGMILSEEHLEHFPGEGPRFEMLEHQIHPIAQLFVPIFFVQMGIRVDLTTFANVQVLALAAALTVAAIIGKQACSLVVGGSIPSRLTIGFGMIPRGEVGLIFASIGLGLGVVTASVFSAVVIMVIVTTLVTPPLLKATMARLPAE